MGDKGGHEAARGEIFQLFAASLVLTSQREDGIYWRSLLLPRVLPHLLQVRKDFVIVKFVATITGNWSFCRARTTNMAHVITFNIVIVTLAPSTALTSVVGEPVSPVPPGGLYLPALSPPPSDWLHYCKRSCGFPSR